MINSVIKGTGKFIPSRRIKNEDFLNHDFFDAKGHKIPTPNEDVLEKFRAITTIEERRYVTNDLVTSDIAYYAAQETLVSAGSGKEDLDYILVAHNFGDVDQNNRSSDFVPSIAARVKQQLGIENPETIAFDLPFGCPGWVQAFIQADYILKSGDAQKILVIGAETLSRVADPHDRDSMLYGDGAGGILLEGMEEKTKRGVMGHQSRSDALHYSHMLYMGNSYNPCYKKPDRLFLKMNGRKLYQYALENVPKAIQSCLEKTGLQLDQVDKLLLHQANGKMDEAILERLYSLNGLDEIPDHIMPMTINKLGNSSVATLPTLLDLIRKNELPNHQIESGDQVVFASVGAGMNINALVYRF